MSNSGNAKPNNFLRPIIIFVIVAIGGFFGYQQVQFSISHETTDNAQVETQITPVVSRVSGYINVMQLKDYDSVKAGDTVAIVDDAEYQTQLEELKADYQQAKVDILNAQASLENAVVSLKFYKGNVSLNELKKQKAFEDYSRDRALFASEAVTKKQFEDSRFAHESAIRVLENSKADLSVAESRVKILESALKKSESSIAIKQAKIDQLKLKISYTKITAPLSGKIGKKNVNEGQFIQAGTPLFSIVNDTTFWIVANFKENQIGSLSQGKEVKIKIDAYPELDIRGKVVSISEATGAKFALLPPDNSSGNFVKVTQRIPVKIAIQDIEKHKKVLRAGMSVFVTSEK